MRKIDPRLFAVLVDHLLTKLEAFSEQFLTLAATADQRNLATEFNAFVEEVIQALLSPGIETGHLAPAAEKEAFANQHGHESLAGLRDEIRADEAAAKREDAHCYGKLSLKTLRSDRTERPVAENGNDKDIER